MKLYLAVDCNDEPQYVEAPTFAAAIEIWKAAKQIEWGADYDDAIDLPTSLTCVSERPVLRAPLDEVDIRRDK